MCKPISGQDRGCLIEYLTFHKQSYGIVQTKFIHSDSVKVVNDPLKGLTPDDAFMINPINKQKATLNAVFSDVAKVNNLWDSIPFDGNTHRKTFNVKFPDPTTRFQIDANGPTVELEAIEFVVDMKIEVEKVPISKVTSYDGQDGPIAQTIEFATQVRDEQHTLKLIKDKTGAISVSREVKKK